MELLPLEYSDMEYLKELQPHDWADIAEPARRNINSSFCEAYKTMVDKTIAGTGAIIYNGNTAWLSGIIVHPGYRNRGLGKMITQSLIDRIDKSLYPTILLDATELGYPVYKKAGFEIISEHVHFQGATIEPGAGINPSIKPFENKYGDQVLELDKIATGERRRATLLEKMDESFVYITPDDKVHGYYMPTLMKGLIVADNPDAGTALMKMRLKEKNSCMLPVENKAAISFLLEAGFKHVKTSKRMRLGKPVRWQPAHIYNVTGGALG